MWLLVLKTFVSAAVIVVASQLANKKPDLAGYIIALPLSSMLALVWNYHEFKDAKVSIDFVKSILSAVPLSLLFFVPFLIADKTKLGFWTNFFGGTSMAFFGFFIQSIIYTKLIK